MATTQTRRSSAVEENNTAATRASNPKRPRGELASSEEEGLEQQLVEVAEEEGRKAGKRIAYVDTDLLDCTICCEPLRAPIFQCEVGHVACLSCVEKLENRCHICRRTIGHIRNIFAEQLIDSAKIQCSNRKYGCTIVFAYSQKQEHESACTYAPVCFCPAPHCYFARPVEALRDHFIVDHGWAPTNLQYGHYDAVRMLVPRDRQFSLIIGEDQSMFLLVNIVTAIGNVVSLVCVRPHAAGAQYACTISACYHTANGERVYAFVADPRVRCTSLSGGFQQGDAFVVVSRGLATGAFNINLKVDKLPDDPTASGLS